MEVRPKCTRMELKGRLFIFTDANIFRIIFHNRERVRERQADTKLLTIMQPISLYTNEEIKLNRILGLDYNLISRFNFLIYSPNLINGISAEELNEGAISPSVRYYLSLSPYLPTEAPRPVRKHLRQTYCRPVTFHRRIAKSEFNSRNALFLTPPPTTSFRVNLEELASLASHLIQFVHDRPGNSLKAMSTCIFANFLCVSDRLSSQFYLIARRVCCSIF